METTQYAEDGNVPSVPSALAEDKPGRGWVGRLAKLMGNTAGLAQNAGVKTADTFVSAGRRVGRLGGIPSAMRSIIKHESNKKRQAQIRRELVRLRGRIQELHRRIGEIVCRAWLSDQAALSADPQLNALIGTVHDLEKEVEELSRQEQVSPGQSSSPEQAELKLSANRETSEVTAASPQPEANASESSASLNEGMPSLGGNT